MTPPTAHPRVGRERTPVRALGRLVGIGIALVLAAGSFVATPLSAAAATAAGPAVAARTTVADAVTVDPGINPLVKQARPLSHIVYGYLPYWRLDSGTAGRLQYDLVSTIAFFGLGIAANGTIGMTAAGREGLHERQRDRRHERRPCRRRPRRPDVPAVRLGHASRR